MWKYCATYNILCIIIVVHGHDFRSFSDTVLFKINWPGEINSDLLDSGPHVEPYLITTANKEQYQCLIIDNASQEQDSSTSYKGPTAMEILFPIFQTKYCSYRIESYWSYELCHGRYVRQYHEDKDGKKVTPEEYYLGTFDNQQRMKLLEQYPEKEENPDRKANIPVKKVDGINMPYVEVEMGDGTICDLTNKPRKIKVLYVCYQHGKHDLFSVGETSSCEYEAIVLSPLLCKHPDYKPQATIENAINCHPVNNAPKRPKSLIAMEIESMNLRYEKQDEQQQGYVTIHVDKEGQGGDSRVRVEIHPVGVTDKHSNAKDSVNFVTDQGISQMKVAPMYNFMSGKSCLHGGNGWWKYEFCYGRSVVQYHIERDGTKTIVNLGKFDKQKHLQWIAAHPHKKPKPPKLRKQLSHFYSDGYICDKTGSPRQTEVKLKCVESYTASPSSVSLFLLEPKTCEYVLGVESPLICDALQFADENGLLSEKFEVYFGQLKTTAFHEYDYLDERIANGDD